MKRKLKKQQLLQMLKNKENKVRMNQQLQLLRKKELKLTKEMWS